MASGVSKNRSGERDDEMTLKKFAGFCGAVTAALFLCPNARADQNFVDFDDYLIAAPGDDGGVDGEGERHSLPGDESRSGCGLGIDSDDFLSCGWVQLHFRGDDCEFWTRSHRRRSRTVKRRRRH